MGKWILPWFGGGPGVWSACLLFFQVMLLGGYLYAHWLGAAERVRTQLVIHACLLAGALAWLPVTPAETWKPSDGASPTWRIVLLLLSSVGLPYFLLASTGPLLQRWLCRVRPGPPPYGLYALSNAGSLLALLSYPFLVEPALTRRQQSAIWSWGFVLYAVFTAWSAWVLWKKTAAAAPGPSSGSGSGPAGDGDTGTQGDDPSQPLPGMAQTSSSSSEPPGPGAGGVPRDPGPATAVTHQVDGAARAFWFLLPFCASVLLLAVTNKISQDIAVVPFLWVLPLVAYLLSFIVAFSGPRWYVRALFAVGLAGSLAAACWALDRGTDYPFKKLVAIYTGALLCCCTVCHAEVYRLRPAAAGLTAFYLAIAAGGAAGGVFVAVLAPMLFHGYYELHWGLFLCGVLFFGVCVRDMAVAPRVNPFAMPTGEGGANGSRREWFWMTVVLTALAMAGLDQLLRLTGHELRGGAELHAGWLRAGTWVIFLTLVAGWVARGCHRRFRHWHLLSCLWLLLGVAALGVVLWQDATKPDPSVVYRNRNFYGTVKITEHDVDDPLGHYRLLQHGGITHGIQFVDRDQSTWATTYYAEGSGLEVAMNALPEQARRIGVVGLGTGSIAAFGKPGDYLRFYEINPEIRRIALHEFTYLAECRGTAEIVLGDARLSMERELPQELDLIALDAFSGDAIPVHLLTREAFALYERHLRPEGIIVVHISNHYVDLEPVVANLAREFRFEARRVDYDEEDTWWKYASTWILLTRSDALLKKLPDRAVPLEEGRKIPLWTDDFASLYQVLK